MSIRNPAYGEIIATHSLGNGSEGRQQFGDAIALISASNCSERLSCLENAVETSFEFDPLTLKILPSSAVST